MYVDTKEAALLNDLSKPSLMALSYILRHKEHWPERFVWDYRQCNTCAMGMAVQLWRKIRVPCVSAIVRELDIPTIQALSIFLGLREAYNPVKPKHVADAIDNYLKCS